ncbi:DUF5713 family protein [Nocardia salmonicida]|uniref:DUF5713 family protein n=1 Tax=Nocardia salmonicida TaxID=53431 RepID=UPI002E2A292B|nr:DUF5713 family protein [Nocardia salmonicida]
MTAQLSVVSYMIDASRRETEKCHADHKPPDRRACVPARDVRGPYYPDAVLDQCTAVLQRLCETIESERPSDLATLYVLTRAATAEFNDLQAEFEAAGSEIETVARESIAADFCSIASAYGFTDADSEELIAGRDW